MNTRIRIDEFINSVISGAGFASGAGLVVMLIVMMAPAPQGSVIHLKTTEFTNQTQISTEADYDKLVDLKNVVVVKKSDDKSVVLDGYTKITFETQAEREKFLQRWEVK